MIKLKRWILIGCAVLAPTLVKADNYMYVNQDACGFDDVSFGMDFLYWKPCMNDLDFAAKFDASPLVGAEGRYKCFDHGYEPGFRVFAHYDNALCRLGLSGSYTYFWGSTRESEEAQGQEELVSTLSRGEFNLGASSEIHAKHSLRYQTFDILTYYEFECFGPSQVLVPFFGVEGLKLDQVTFSRAISSANPANAVEIRWDSEYRGVGIKVGTEYRLCLPCNFEWFFLGSFSILAGESHAEHNLQNIDSQPTVRFSFKECENMCQPGCRLAAGLRYDLNLCGKVVKLQAGYEFLDWWNVPKIRRTNISGTNLFLDPTTLSTGSNLTLHGLFAGLDLGF